MQTLKNMYSELELPVYAISLNEAHNIMTAVSLLSAMPMSLLTVDSYIIIKTASGDFTLAPKKGSTAGPWGEDHATDCLTIRMRSKSNPFQKEISLNAGMTLQTLITNVSAFFKQAKPALKQFKPERRRVDRTGYMLRPFNHADFVPASLLAPKQQLLSRDL